MTDRNDAVKESLSALMDGENTELDLHRVLKAASSDSSVLDSWSAYHQSRQALNKEADVVCDSTFLSGIQAAIAEDTAPAMSKNRGFQRFAAKGAVAACVTFAFLLGANQFQSADGSKVEESPAIADTAVSTSVPSGFELPPLTARTVSSLPSQNFLLSQPSAAPEPSNQFVLSPEMQEQLNRMIMRHTERSSANGGLGVLPFSRVSLEDNSAQK